MNEAQIVKFECRKSPEELHDEYVAAMWLLFLRCPGQKTAAGQVVDLGEIGSVRLNDQRFNRETPYSVCTGIRHDE